MLDKRIPFLFILAAMTALADQRTATIFDTLQPVNAGKAWLAAPAPAFQCDAASRTPEKSIYNRIVASFDSILGVRPVKAQSGCGGHYFKTAQATCGFCRPQFAISGGSNWSTGYIPYHHYICGGQCPEDILCSSF